MDDLDGSVVVVEIKSTDWDRIRPPSRRGLIGRHRRQVWKYINEFLGSGEVDVVAGIIYPQPPTDPNVRSEIEECHGDYGLQVVWYDELPDSPVTPR